MSKTDFQNGFALGMASGGVVEVIDTTETDALEDLIDESGVLEDTEGTVTEKVEQLIDKAEELDIFMNITGGAWLFNGATTFPSKATVNLPNVYDLNNGFSNWNNEPIPIVEKLTINAPNLINGNVSSMFSNNKGVKNVILNLSNNCENLTLLFSGSSVIEEAVLNFSTKNITKYTSVFSNAIKLKKIVGVLDFSSATTVQNMFWNCYNLEEVTFEKDTLSLTISLGWSGMLSAESIQSIIDGLATVETAQTLGLNSAITLTDEQKATINEKGWTLAQ